VTWVSTNFYDHQGFQPKSHYEYKYATQIHHTYWWNNIYVIWYPFRLIRLFPKIFAILSHANKSIVPSISKIQLDWPSLRHQAKSSFLRSEFMSLFISHSEHIWLFFYFVTRILNWKSKYYFRNVQESGYCDPN